LVKDEELPESDDAAAAAPPLLARGTSIATWNGARKLDDLGGLMLPADVFTCVWLPQKSTFDGILDEVLATLSFGSAPGGVCVADDSLPKARDCC